MKSYMLGRVRKIGIQSLAVACVLVAASAVRAQWDPANGDWSKTSSTDLRVMTWNIEDGICRTASKVEGLNAWCALARIVASMKPDVLIMQEAGDNSGNGTGSGVDSVADLTTTIGLFLHGGTDPFVGGNPTVTAYVQKYDAAYDLPFVFVSTSNDGFNRNVILSRYPFIDLNGDTLTQRSDIPSVSADQYAPGGNGGIRGFMMAEFDLPNETYLGNLMVGNCHLKAGGTSGDLAERVEASQNIAYVIDYWLNGANVGTPDPNNKIGDFPAATTILAANTPFIWGGDLNEDELTNGRKGPAEWTTLAQTTGGTDGTDRNRTDSTYDAATHVFTGSRVTQGSSSKLDYLLWQDSIATLRRAFVFNTSGTPTNALPPELDTFAFPAGASGQASDHRPVIADFILPLGIGLGACCTGTNCSDGISEPTCTSGGGEYQGDGTNCGTISCEPPPNVRINEIRIEQDGTDTDEFFELVGTPGTSLDGLTYLVIGDGLGGSGVIEAVVNLTGNSIPGDGFFLAVEDTFSIGGGLASADLNTGTGGLNFEDADNVTHLLVQGFAGANGQDLDTNDDGVLDVTPWIAVIDSIALIRSDNPPVGTEYHYGPPTVGPDAGAVPGLAYRCPDETGTWVIGAISPTGLADTPGGPNNCSPPIPAASTWSMIALGLLLLVAGTVAVRRDSNQPVCGEV